MFKLSKRLFAHPPVSYPVLVLGACFIATGHAVAGDAPAEVEGAWELTDYELAGEDVAVSGVLVLRNGDFGMIYAIGDDPADAGRAHFGRYQVRNDRLTFDVELWVQRFEGATGIIPAKSVGADMRWRDGRLKLHFEGGSIQTLRPLETLETRDSLKPGSWSLDPEQNLGDGGLVVHENRFVLVYLDKQAATGVAYGGTGGGNGKTLNPQWSISISGNSGAVVTGEATRQLQFEGAANCLRIRGVAEEILTFSAR